MTKWSLIAQSFQMWFAMPAIILTVLKVVDKIFGKNPPLKKLGKILVSPSSSFFSKAYVNSVHVSDRLFGDKLFSFRAFFVSAIITIIWVLLQIIVALYNSPHFLENGKAFFLVESSWFLLVAIVIDYISVCITRYVLIFAIDKSMPIQVLVLITEFILSVLLFYFFYTCIKVIVIDGTQFLPLGISLKSWLTLPYNFIGAFKFLHEVALIPNIDGTSFTIVNGEAQLVYSFPEGIFFISSLLTSIWIWALVIGEFVYKLSNKFFNFKNHFVKDSLVEENPLQVTFLTTLLLFYLPAWLVYVFFAIFEN